MPAGDEPPCGGERELTQSIAARNEQGRTSHGGAAVSPAQRERLDLAAYAAQVACPQQVALARLPAGIEQPLGQEDGPQRAQVAI